jgi:PhzF family phenazine biosynthesis protein
MHATYHVIDAFTDQVFSGNPAAVLVLDAFPPDTLMQKIAAENNLSETAFVVPNGADWNLRWFTPTTEVELCGHATLASSFVLRESGAPAPYRFHTLSGLLTVTSDGPRLVMDFPAWRAEPATPPPGLSEALGATPREVYRARDWICVLDSPEQVKSLTPDHAKVAALPGTERVIVTAAGGEGVDISSRYFAAKVGVNEDPATGAAHTQLVPFWAPRLGKPALACRQVSARGGMLWCDLAGDRVKIAGTAVRYARGEIQLPD